MLWRRRVLPIRSLDSKAGRLAGGDGACADPRRSARAHEPRAVAWLRLSRLGFPVLPVTLVSVHTSSREAMPACCTEPQTGPAPPAPDPQAASKPHCPPVRASGSVGRPVGSQPRHPPSPGPILPGSAATSTGPCARVPCTHSVLSGRWARSPQFLSCLPNAPREPSRLP